MDLDDEVLGVGMPCGGTMEVYIEAFRPRPELLIVGHGRIAEMLAELGQRGVDRELARDALREIEQEESVDWYQLATEALERRFGRGPAGDPKERARRERFLAGRGFDFDHVREALRAMSEADT